MTDELVLISKSKSLSPEMSNVTRDFQAGSWGLYMIHRYLT